jgi:hypothetical protein
MVAKPRYGYFSRGFSLTDAEEIYSEEYVIDLITRFDLANDIELETLKEHLEGAADVYRTYLHNHDDAPRNKEIRSAINEIASLSEKLSFCLENMDDWTWHYFWRPEMSLRNQISRKLIEKDIKTFTSEFGQTVTMYEDENGNVTVTHLTEKDYLEALAVLRAYAERALSEVPVDKGGQTQSEALRMWVVNAHTLWVDLIGRDFTVSRHRGRPVSDSACFCCAAFKPIDAEIKESAIMTEMHKLTNRKKIKNSSK